MPPIIGHHRGVHFVAITIKFKYFANVKYCIAAKKYYGVIGENIERHVANSHSIFNIINCIIFIPLAGLMAFVVTKLVRGEVEVIEHETKYLDERMLITPEIAIKSSRLPGNFHGDPADRIIVSTARKLNATLITHDKNILRYSKDDYLKVIKG